MRTNAGKDGRSSAKKNGGKGEGKDGGKVKWSNRFYVIAYQYAMQGFNNEQISNALGLGVGTLAFWKKKKPTLKWAIEEGRGNRDKGLEDQGRFQDFVFKQLPPNLKGLWKKINRIRKEKGGYMKIQAMLEDKGKYVRMHLFLHALSVYKFNVSLACRKVGISLKEFNKWKDTEPDFLDLISEMQYHQKIFFQDALIKSVSRGDTAAVLFANKTYNKDWYSDPGTRVEVTGQVNHNHQHLHKTIDLDVLDLPLDVRKIILQKHREYLAKQAGASTPIAGVLEYKRSGNLAVPIEEDGE